LLSLEIDQNLDLLRELWNKANQVKESDQNPNLSKARRLVEMSLPLWSHKAWESQIPLLAIALSEKEIKQVHDFHSRLDMITVIHSKLSALKVEEEIDLKEDLKIRAVQGRRPFSHFVSGCKFIKNAPKLWEEFEQIVCDMLNRGNPLETK